ncbi:nitrile hydratase subunit alpha [Pseudomonas typographi]|uniref:nitrile hydratase n=1 Tax=Pseudomonas typographi TaxID=2715964 RepID=A0ABR7YZY9_9PSED|nr:nitrile hydratase subunit alpha [Pseudomonas typographi]MBD1598758.1 nitrile hydratase subunit alpha [Pseudomonas typographi]
MAERPHDHDHDHDDHPWTPPSDIEARVRALESLLVEKGLTTHDAIDTLISAFENDLGPMHGARVVAKAWSDPAYRQRLEADGTNAIAELGYRGLQTEHVKALFNSATDHHMWVCTLCSCYPWTLLGIPPVWFKSAPYRSRVVSHPREVLADFGVTLDPTVKVHVWDTSAEQRYIVIPERPDGTQGFTEEQLAALVTRDSMIGTGFVKRPGATDE